MGTDALNAHAVAMEIAVNLGGVVMPPLYWGTERERSPNALRDIGFEGDEWIVGMDFPANRSMRSLYSPEDIFGVIMRERLRQLIDQEYKLIVLVNGHGADNHIRVLTRLSSEFSQTKGVSVCFPQILNPTGDVLPMDYGHANLPETALMMRLHPGDVRMDILPPKPVPMFNTDYAIVDGETFQGNPSQDRTVRGDPRDATAVDGDVIYQRAVRMISATVRAEMQRVLGQ
jgi:creatinine amidohydrolase